MISHQDVEHAWCFSHKTAGSRTRSYIISAPPTQSVAHQTGSWHIPGDIGADRGGRLYSTSLSTMILEVYYRHMPLYGRQAAEDDFPLN